MIWLYFACASDVAKVDDQEQVDPTEEIPTWTDISDLLEEIHASSDAPALGAARVRGGVVTEMGTVGLRSANEDAEVTDFDKWHLGSCTKAMTGTLTGVLVDEGLLSWDSTMSELFTNVDVHEDYQNVTVEMMLSHTGGAWSSLTSHTDTWATMRAGGDVIEVREQVVEDVLTEAPEVSPGSSFVYSNAGYIIVGSALERLTGVSWEELMQDEIFTPLEMSSCGFGPPDIDGSLQHPWGHYQGEPVDPTSANADNPPSLGPAGTVHCNLNDWSKFVAEQMKLYRGEAGLLSAEQAEHMFEVQLNSYGMGWFVVSQPWASGATLSHAGSNAMNRALVWAAPELDEAYLAVANSGTEETYLSLDESIVMLIELP